MCGELWCPWVAGGFPPRAFLSFLFPTSLSTPPPLRGLQSLCKGRVRVHVCLRCGRARRLAALPRVHVSLELAGVLFVHAMHDLFSHIPLTAVSAALSPFLPCFTTRLLTLLPLPLLLHLDGLLRTRGLLFF